MSDSEKKTKNMENSIADQSVLMFVTEDDSLAAPLLNNDINVRDFILLFFLDDQGPMKIVELSREICIEPEYVEQRLERLSAAGFVVREPLRNDNKLNETAQLTDRGWTMVSRVNRQL